jgi:hypothetical protein
VRCSLVGENELIGSGFGSPCRANNGVPTDSGPNSSRETKTSRLPRSSTVPLP